MKHRDIEVGQIRIDGVLFREGALSEQFIVKRVDETEVVVKFLDTWDTDENDYVYQKDYLLKRTILIM